LPEKLVGKLLELQGHRRILCGEDQGCVVLLTEDSDQITFRQVAEVQQNLPDFVFSFPLEPKAL
jgi:hypothetical protein